MAETPENQGLDPRSEQELRRLAYRDHLTGLPNRTAMTARIESAVRRSERGGGAVALLLVDLDAFKRVNDTLGRAAGDRLLGLVGERLSGLEGPRLELGRHGGDEFMVLVEELPRDPLLATEAVRGLAGRILDALRAPFTVQHASFEVSASIGASILPHDALNDHELLGHADQAVYVAKRRERGKLALFEAVESHSVLELESSLRVRRALAGGELELFYQPVLEIADGRGLGGLEALLRWRDPDRGLLLPETFLPFIEHSSLVEEIAEWVFSEICRQLSAWRARDFSPRISFNIPARQLRRQGFVQFVIDTAAASGCDLTRLAAEITETSALSLREAMPTLRALDEAGFVLSLDDFGTGYSSLARLRTMPFTLLKTDRSFMHGIPGDPVAEELLEGIITLGRRLGMRVIVEGVESAEQEQAVVRLGGRIAQGYHLGAPMPPAEIEARFSDSALRGAGARL